MRAIASHHSIMDFGLGEILRHFEEHFGKKVARILLGVIGLAIFGVCLNLIWDHIVAPILVAFGWSRDHFNQLPQIPLWVTEVVLAIFALLIGSAYWIKRNERKRKVSVPLKFPVLVPQPTPPASPQHNLQPPYWGGIKTSQVIDASTDAFMNPGSPMMRCESCSCIFRAVRTGVYLAGFGEPFLDTVPCPDCGHVQLVKDPPNGGAF